MALVVLLGGARSGKSALAQRLASASDAAVTFIATAEPGDQEMADRIARHRAVRPASWTTVEEPLDLVGALAAAPVHACVIVDCLTLWIANAMGFGSSAEEIEEQAVSAASLAAARNAPTIVVSNEVGMGVVPATELGRAFRDLQGRVNRRFCDVSDRAALVVAGQALELSSTGGLEDLISHA